MPSARPFRIYINHIFGMFVLLLYATQLYAHNYEKLDSRNQYNDLVEECMKLSSAEHLNVRPLDSVYYYKSIQLLEWAQTHGNRTDVTDAKFIILTYYLSHFNEVEIIKRSKELLADPTFSNSVTGLKVMYSLIKSYERTEQFNSMLQLYPTFYKLIKELNNPLGWEQNQYFGDIGNVYFNLKNYSGAILSYKKALKIQRKEETWLRYSSVANNIALAFYKKGYTDSAIHFWEIAENTLERYVANTAGNDLEYAKHFLNVIKANKSKIWIDEGRFNDALVVLHEELKSSRLALERHITISALFQIAEIQFLMERPLESLNYLDSVFIELAIYQDNAVQIKALDLKGRCLLMLDQTEQSNSFFKKRDLFSDSISILKAQNAAQFAAVKYETSQKELELVKAKQEIVSANIQNWIMASTLFVVFLFVLGGIYFYRRVLISNKIISHQKTALEKSVNEKETLLKEIHHRVKNNLQIISGLLELQSQKLDHPLMEELVAESQRYIGSMVLVHQMLYQNGNITQVNAKEYFSSLTIHLLNGFSNHGLKPKLDVSDKAIPLEQAIPLGIALCEMLLNTFKHAYHDKTGSIELTINISKNNFKFEYKDFGTGFLEDRSKNTEQESIGLTLISLFAEEIGAELKITGKPGVTYYLHYNRQDVE